MVKRLQTPRALTYVQSWIILLSPTGTEPLVDSSTDNGITVAMQYNHRYTIYVHMYSEYSGSPVMQTPLGSTLRVLIRGVSYTGPYTVSALQWLPVFQGCLHGVDILLAYRGLTHILLVLRAYSKQFI